MSESTTVLRDKGAMFNAEIGDLQVIRGFNRIRDTLRRLGIPFLVLSPEEPKSRGMARQLD